MFGYLPKSGKEGAATNALPKKSRLDDAFVRYPGPDNYFNFLID